MTKTRKLLEFDLDEISLVDDGAAAPARVAILKRNGERVEVDRKQFEEELILKNLVMTTSENGHAHLIDPSQHNGQGGFTSPAMDSGAEEDHDHPWVRTADGIVIGDADGHSHGLVGIQKNAGGAESLENEDAGDGETTDGGNPTMSEQLTKDAGESEQSLEELKAQNAAFQKRAERAESVSLLSDEQRTFYKSLDGEEAQDEFLGLDDAAKDARIEKANAPVTEYFSKALNATVSGDQIAIAKALDAERDARMASEAAAQATVIEKRAETELSNLPGEALAKQALLQAVDTVDASVRPDVLAILKAANDRGASAGDDFVPAGEEGETIQKAADARARFQKGAQKFAKDNGMKLSLAIRKFAETDEGRALMRESRNQE